MNSSVHFYDINKSIIVLDEGATQTLDDTTLTAEPKYPVHFTQSGMKFVLSLHCNGSKTFLMY